MSGSDNRLRRAAAWEIVKRLREHDDDKLRPLLETLERYAGGETTDDELLDGMLGPAGERISGRTLTTKRRARTILERRVQGHSWKSICEDLDLDDGQARRLERRERALAESNSGLTELDIDELLDMLASAP